ncbi:MAG TPA: hypothetical protein VKB53_12550 [Gammaproteobacteria bacterium]|nr:hypothetical protein [Gammaproteobacteria bacterium]
MASGHKSQDGKLDLTAERAKLTRAQTEKTEIEVAHLRGGSLPRTLVVLSQLGASLLASPAVLPGIA